MLDIKFLRENPEVVKQNIRNKFQDQKLELVDKVIELDKENTGFILNAIHSRDNCFLYLKEIVKGESYIMLSTEEIDALRQAITMNSIDLM